MLGGFRMPSARATVRSQCADQRVSYRRTVSYCLPEGMPHMSLTRR